MSLPKEVEAGIDGVLSSADDAKQALNRLHELLSDVDANLFPEVPAMVAATQEAHKAVDAAYDSGARTGALLDRKASEHVIADAEHFQAQLTLERAMAVVELIANHDSGNASDSKIKSLAAWQVLEMLESLPALLGMEGDK